VDFPDVKSDSSTRPDHDDLRNSLANYLSVPMDIIPDFTLSPGLEWKDSMVEWLSSMGYEFNEFSLVPVDQRKYIALKLVAGGVSSCVVWRCDTVNSSEIGDILSSPGVLRFWYFEKIPMEDESYYQSVIDSSRLAKIEGLLSFN
jgi:hypothetical protein